MLIRKLFLLGVAFFAIGPHITMAAAFPIQKRSTLPCLIGNPSFSELLIDNNPRLAGRAYAMSDAVLWHGLISVKRSEEIFTEEEPDEKETRKKSKVSYEERFREWVNFTTKKSGSLGKVNLLLEFGIYLHRYAMVYLALKDKAFDTYALSIGNNRQPFNIHANIGKFPIPFGSSFTEYSFAGPLQPNLGAAASAPATSLNLAYHWNMEHKSKVKVFGFMQQCMTIKKLTCTTKQKNPYKSGEKSETALDIKKEYQDKKWGVNIGHEWKPYSKSIDSINVGLSFVSGLPAVEILNGSSAAGGYCHLHLGSVKIKCEGVVDNPRDFWKKKKGSRSDTVSTKSGSSSRRSNTPNRRAPSEYVAHGELCYKFPGIQTLTSVIGYTCGDSQFLAASQRVFGGFKIGLLDNLNFTLGYQAEKDSKKRYKESKISPGRIAYQEEKRYDNEWRHSLTIQFSFDI